MSVDPCVQDFEHSVLNDLLPDSLRTSSQVPSRKDLGEAFVSWLRLGVLTHKIIINDSKAKVHSVAETAFLVTPGIFQRYAQEHPHIARMAKEQGTTDWRWVQRCFETLGLHKKCPSGLNIWACEVPEVSKNFDEHYVPIHSKLAKYLRILLLNAKKRGIQQNEQLFNVNKFSQRHMRRTMDMSQLSRFYTALSHKLGVHVSPHRFRHTIATDLMRQKPFSGNGNDE